MRCITVYRRLDTRYLAVLVRILFVYGYSGFVEMSIYTLLTSLIICLRLALTFCAGDLAIEILLLHFHEKAQVNLPPTCSDNG